MFSLPYTFSLATHKLTKLLCSNVHTPPGKKGRSISLNEPLWYGLAVNYYNINYMFIGLRLKTTIFPPLGNSFEDVLVAYRSNLYSFLLFSITKYQIRPHFLPSTFCIAAFPKLILQLHFNRKSKLISRLKVPIKTKDFFFCFFYTPFVLSKNGVYKTQEEKPTIEMQFQK